MSLAELRARGLSLSGGPKLRVVGPAAVVTEQRPLLEAQRDELLGALHDEAEDEIAGWPLAYRRWTVQTIAYCLRVGADPQTAFWQAYQSIAAEYAEHRARVAELPIEDQMLAAALDSWPGAYLADDEAIESAG